MTTNENSRRLLSRKEVAQHLGVSELTVHRMAKRGELPFFKFGRSRRYRMEDVEAFLAGKRATHEPEIPFEDVLAARSKRPSELNRVSLLRPYRLTVKNNVPSFALVVLGSPTATASENDQALKRVSRRFEGRGLGWARLLVHLDPLPPKEGLTDTAQPAVVHAPLLGAFVFGADLALVELLVESPEVVAVAHISEESGGNVSLHRRGVEPVEVGTFEPRRVADAIGTALGYGVNFEYPAQTWMEAVIEQASKPTS